MFRSLGWIGALLLLSTAACSLDYLDRDTDREPEGDYYVAITGSDERSCEEAKSKATPRRTIRAGASCLVAGETLLVRGGRYDESITDGLPSGTSWDEKVRIAAYGEEEVWLAPSAATGGSYALYMAATEQYIELDGINMDTSEQGYGSIVKIEAWNQGNPHHIRIQNAELIGGSDGVPSQESPTGIVLSASAPSQLGSNELINLRIHGGGDPGDPGAAIGIGSDDNLIDGCEIYDWNNFGIILYSEQTMPSNNVMRNNRIYDITRGESKGNAGILSFGREAEIYNNIVYAIGANGVEGMGIKVYNGSIDAKVVNNTVYGNDNHGIVVDTAAVTGTLVQNNIAFGNPSNDFADYGTATMLVTNLFDDDPLFVDAAGGDFRLRSGSPAIDAGTTSELVTTDFAQQKRPRGGGYDIGAYER